jgi:Flp pilus assembly pilin Flp
VERETKSVFGLNSPAFSLKILIAVAAIVWPGEQIMNNLSQKLFGILRNEEGQDIAEYAVMLAVILVLVIGTIRLVGSNSNNAFSSVASSLQ